MPSILWGKTGFFFLGEFLGGPVVRSPHFHCRGHRVNPQLGSKILHAAQCSQKKKKKDVFKLELYTHSKQINYKCRMRKFSDIQVSKLYLQNTLL